MFFEPIAIIGQACLYPGIFSPDALWQATMEKKDCLTEVPKDRWIIDPAALLNPNYHEHILTTRAGYVTGFNELFDPQGFAVPAEEINKFGPVFQWPLHLARTALMQTRYDYRDLCKYRVGAIFANLAYPTRELAELTLQTWLDQQEPELKALFTKTHEWRNRFSSGFPAQFLAQALQLKGAAFTIDAACGSAVYALNLACKELSLRRADFMLAGAINAIDEIFVLMGFAGAHALSPTGRSQPFDRAADGLVPTEGGSLFVLKRLSDAVHDRDQILGVIRGIGLSNDGNGGGGLLAPSVAAQVLAMQRAYHSAELDPKLVSYIECHATGTPVGDKVELHGLQQIFKENNNLKLGALKSNLGHALTASTGAAVNRVLCAMQQGIIPPIRCLNNPIDDLSQTNFTVLMQPQAWEASGEPLYAAVNGFGMGGTNAHLILEKYQPSSTQHFYSETTHINPSISIVTMSSMVGASDGIDSLTRHLLCNESLLTEIDGVKQARIEEIELAIKLHFPPKDLKEALGQQLAILHTGLNAIAQLKQAPANEKVGVYIGMGCDPEIARHCLRWILPGLFAKQGIVVSPEWLEQVLDTFSTAGSAAHILGAMPNVIASRIAIEKNYKGPCFAVCNEELSGITALKIACDALKLGEIDMAIVGAVDMSCEVVHQLAATKVLPEIKQIAGDAAVVMVLKRTQDARKDGEEIYAVIPEEVPSQPDYQISETTFVHLFGHAHAASGLLHVALAALACYWRLLPATAGKKFPTPWISAGKPCTAEVNIQALGGQCQQVFLTSDQQAKHKPFLLNPVPHMYCFSGNNHEEVMRALQNKIFSQQGPVRLVIVAENEDALLQKQQIALRLLNSAKNRISLPHQGIYYREQPLKGEIAFVFASSNTSYPDMGIDLALAFPELLAKIQQRYGNLGRTLSLIYRESLTNSFVDEHLATGFISLLHFLLIQEVLGIKPNCVMGHSMGEMNAIHALGIFRDLENMENEEKECGLATKLLQGEYLALRQYYPYLNPDQVAWENWRVYVDVDEVKKILAEEPYCHITVINTSKDCIIAGLPQVCHRVITKLNAENASGKLKVDVMSHCPEAHAIASLLYQIHHRKVYPPPPEVRIYSGISGTTYPIDSDNVAEHLFRLCTEMVNFPRLIHNAWQDGVRIFIELGAQGLCTQWIKENLGDQDYLVTHFDKPGRSGLAQIVHAMAELVAAGIDVNYNYFSERIYEYKQPF